MLNFKNKQGVASNGCSVGEIPQRVLLLADKQVILDDKLVGGVAYQVAEKGCQAYLAAGGLAGGRATGGGDTGIAFWLQERSLPAVWSGQSNQVRQELLEVRHVDDCWQLRGAVAPAGSWRPEQLQAFLRNHPTQALEQATQAVKTEIIAPDTPLALASCEIPKLWGKEIWLTGMEARGVTRVGWKLEAAALPHAIGLMPEALLGHASEPPILLKVLETHPVAGWGDLYLEVHQDKWEVYLILDINAQRWHDGKGNLLCGLSALALKNGNKQAVRQKLKKKIEDYKKIRDKIDRNLEKALVRGIAESSLDERQQAQANLPLPWLNEEQKSRGLVEELLGSHSLGRGDVVTLPPKTLHSLRGGTRVLEFQTPTYERLIAMSSQKVLTQPEWDTEAALQLAEMEAFRMPTCQSVNSSNVDVIETQLADFPDFSVQQRIISREKKASFDQPSNDQPSNAQPSNAQPSNAQPSNDCQSGSGHTYQILFVANGQGQMHLKSSVFSNARAFQLEKNQAWLLPAQLSPPTFEAGTTNLELVFAKPKTKK